MAATGAPSPGPRPSVLSDAFPAPHVRTAQQRAGRGGRKQIFNLPRRVDPLLPLHVQHQSLHSREILRRLRARKGTKQTSPTSTKTASVAGANTSLRLAPPPHPPPSPALHPSALPLPFHVRYVTALFPCPGATYSQGKHGAVCVDDCQPRPFIICQASVLRGGKYTQ